MPYDMGLIIQGRRAGHLRQRATIVQCPEAWRWRRPGYDAFEDAASRKALEEGRLYRHRHRKLCGRARVLDRSRAPRSRILSNGPGTAMLYGRGTPAGQGAPHHARADLRGANSVVDVDQIDVVVGDTGSHADAASGTFASRITVNAGSSVQVLRRRTVADKAAGARGGEVRRRRSTVVELADGEVRDHRRTRRSAFRLLRAWPKMTSGMPGYVVARKAWRRIWRRPSYFTPERSRPTPAAHMLPKWKWTRRRGWSGW